MSEWGRLSLMQIKYRRGTATRPDYIIASGASGAKIRRAYQQDLSSSENETMISAALSHHERGTDGVESFGSYLVSMRKMPGSLMAVVLFSPDSAKRYPELGPDQVRIMSADAAQILYTSRCL